MLNDSILIWQQYKPDKFICVQLINAFSLFLGEYKWHSTFDDF